MNTETLLHSVRQASIDGGQTWVKSDNIRHPLARGSKLLPEDFRYNKFRDDHDGAFHSPGFVARVQKCLDEYKAEHGWGVKLNTMMSYFSGVIKSCKKGTAMTNAGLEKIAEHGMICHKAAWKCSKIANATGMTKTIQHRLAFLNPEDDPKNPTMFYVKYRQTNSTIIFSAYINFVNWAVYNASKVIKNAQELARRAKIKAAKVAAKAASLASGILTKPPLLKKISPKDGVRPIYDLYYSKADLIPRSTPDPWFYDTKTGEILAVDPHA